LKVLDVIHVFAGAAGRARRVGCFERRENALALGDRHRVAQPSRGRDRRGLGGFSRSSLAEAQMFRSDRPTAGEHDAALDRIAKLAQIARPGIPEEHVERLGAERRRRSTEPRVRGIGKARRQRLNLAPSLAQRRNTNRQAVETKVEVASKASGFDVGFEVAVGRADEANVDALGPRRADAAHLAVVERAQQLGLDLERHLAELVQEERAAVCGFDQTFTSGRRSGEGAAFVPEELALEQRLGEGGAVDANERTVSA
jgi:hypothetical protein